MKLAMDTMLTMDNETAFFSGVWPRVPETQPRITELTEYTPKVCVNGRASRGRRERRTRSEEEARNVACSYIECRSTDDEAHCSKSHHHGDVPGALVEFSG
jgi:hypothetical protein